MSEKAESLLQTPITKKPFPTTAAYSRDKLRFAHNYIDEILKWQKLCAEELLQLQPKYACSGYALAVIEGLLAQINKETEVDYRAIIRERAEKSKHLRQKEGGEPQK